MTHLFNFKLCIFIQFCLFVLVEVKLKLYYVLPWQMSKNFYFTPLNHLCTVIKPQYFTAWDLTCIAQQSTLCWLMCWLRSTDPGFSNLVIVIGDWFKAKQHVIYCSGWGYLSSSLDLNSFIKTHAVLQIKWLACFYQHFKFDLTRQRYCMSHVN